MKRITRLATVIFAIMGATSAYAWPQDEARLGAQNHPKFLSQQGGVIQDANLSNYVTAVGARIVEQTPLANEKWVFSVTDTPVVNAFAAPGGYVYITRGLLALANSEAELAAVIGHEVAHLTASHHSKRQKRGKDAGVGVLVGTVLGGILGGKDGLKKGIELSSKAAAGYVGQFSQSQEFEADQLGTRYLASAGYNPYAQAAILQSLGAKRAFEARKSGKSYNPNRVDFFATHPATKDRVKRAGDIARRLATGGSDIDAEDVYMNSIDGMVYGDSAEQGFVRGRKFQHPVIGFEYSVPQNFTITNSASRIVAQGPNGAQFNLDGGGATTSSAAEYLKSVWVRQIERDVRIDRLSEIKNFTRNGVNGAHAVARFKRNGADWLGHMTVIVHRNRFIKLTGLTPASAQNLLPEFDKAAASFRALAEWETADMKPYRLRTYRVRPGDTVDWLSLASPSQQDRHGLFRTLNGIPDQAPLTAGDLVKVVTE